MDKFSITNIIKENCILLLCMGVWPAWMSVCHVYVWCPRRPEENMGACDWSYRQLWVPCGHLGSGFSGREAASALNHLAISLAPQNSYILVKLANKFKSNNF